MFSSSFTFKRLSSILRMASKTPRLHPLAVDASGLHPAKKSRRIRTNSTMTDAFQKYTDYLNALNDKRERIVKASRDVTIHSKKVIFQVHRISKDNKEEVLERAEKDLGDVTRVYMTKLVKELDGTDFWKLRRAYSPAVQEYVEAATFYNFCKTGTLLSLADINASLSSLNGPPLEPLQINILDYLLGVGDLTGELMRLAIGRISDGELEYAQTICKFVQSIYGQLIHLVPIMDDSFEMKKKMEIMHQSMVKIENACYSVHVRGSENIPSLASGDPGYSYLILPEIDA